MDISCAEMQKELEERERRFVLKTLDTSKQNKLRAPQAPGITRPAPYRAVRRLGIPE